MRVALDLDGTISADPERFRKLAAALRAKGHKVTVLTGCHHDPLLPTCKDEKKALLESCGFGHEYDKLKVYPQNSVAQDKADYCRRKGVAIMVDNSQRNAQYAPECTTVLVPWHTIVG